MKCGQWIPDTGRYTRVNFSGRGRTCRNKYIEEYEMCEPCMEARAKYILGENKGLTDAIKYAIKQGWYDTP